MASIENTIKDLQRIPAPLNIDKIIAYILQWYEQKSLEKLKTNKIPIMTESLLKKTKTVIKSLKIITKHWDDRIDTRIHQRIRKVIIMINENCHMEKKQAPVIEWNLAKKIARSLWNDISVKQGSNIKMIRHRKAAATLLLLAHKSGGRWIDHHRLFWQDLKFSKVNGKKVVQAQ